MVWVDTTLTEYETRPYISGLHDWFESNWDVGDGKSWLEDDTSLRGTWSINQHWNVKMSTVHRVVSTNGDIFDINCGNCYTEFHKD